VPDLGELIDLGQQGGAKDILGRVYEYTLCAEWNGWVMRLYLFRQWSYFI
jgi:hypothetical protein